MSFYETRQTGKSTLVREFTDGPYPARCGTLDNAGVKAVAGADHTGCIAGIIKPAVIDETYRVRGLLPAIKRAAKLPGESFESFAVFGLFKHAFWSEDLW